MYRKPSARSLRSTPNWRKTWPVIVERTDALPEADEWNNKPDKLKYLLR
jgi:hypothetical protein